MAIFLKGLVFGPGTEKFFFVVLESIDDISPSTWTFLMIPSSQPFSWHCLRIWCCLLCLQSRRWSPESVVSLISPNLILYCWNESPFGSSNATQLPDTWLLTKSPCPLESVDRKWIFSCSNRACGSWENLAWKCPWFFSWKFLLSFFNICWSSC